METLPTACFYKKSNLGNYQKNFIQPKYVTCDLLLNE